jgi:hypothetical protein
MTPGTLPGTFRIEALLGRAGMAKSTEPRTRPWGVRSP